MDYIDENEFNELVQERKGVHVSIYLPVEQEPDKWEMNKIRLKNLIKQGKSQFSDLNFFPSDINQPDGDQFFQPAEELTSQLSMERIKGDGLAIFMGETIQRIHPLPVSVEEYISFGSRFNIRPLLPFMTENSNFYLLALSKAKAQLWRGNRFELEPIKVPQLPKGMDEALALEDPERALQFHTSTGQSADRAAVHHGHEADKEKKGAVLRYFRQVNDAILSGLSDEEDPLLIAAVDYLIPIYQEANTYPHLLDEGVTGNPDHLDDKELHQKAWQTAERHFNEIRKTIVDRFGEVKGTEKSSQKVEEIIPAAVSGRVDTLFILKDIVEPAWGKFNEDSYEVERCESNSFECDDLLNLAAVKTLQNSGDVFAISAEEMPDQLEIAAIYRYAL